MRIVSEYSHFGGVEIMLIRHDRVNVEVNAAIAQVKATRIGAGCSCPLPRPWWRGYQDVGSHLGATLYERGFDVVDDPCLKLPRRSWCGVPSANRQLGFVRDRVFVAGGFLDEFIPADMSYYQRLYDEHKVDVGIAIIPWRGRQSDAFLNVFGGEIRTCAAERFKPYLSVVPVKVILIDADDDEGAE